MISKSDAERIAKEVMEMIRERNGQSYLYGVSDIRNALLKVQADTARECADIAYLKRKEVSENYDDTEIMATNISEAIKTKFGVKP